jgi:glycosyltransferase involved in cell wall biosynthesis
MRRISSFTGVKNRYRTLRANIGSWLNFAEISEFVIVDWDSQDMGQAEHDYLSSLDPRVKIVRVSNQPRYHIAAALNMAAKRTTGNWLVRLDVDYALNPYYNIFDAYQPEKNEFITGDWTQKKLDNEYGFIEYLNGFLYVSRAAFQAVSGYDERMKDYGWEDDNLYLRLIDAGYERKILDASQQLIYHTPHGHDVRMVNFKEKNREVSWKKNWTIGGKPEIVHETTVTLPRKRVGGDGPLVSAPTPPPLKQPAPAPAAAASPPIEPPAPAPTKGRMSSKFAPKNI